MARHRLLREAAGLGALALLLAAAVWRLHPGRAAWTGAVGPGEITVARAAALGDAVLWVDARPQAAYDQGHLPGALRLTEEVWETAFLPLLDRWVPGQPVIVYCDSRACRASHRVAERLRQAGVQPVSVLRGGWAAWQAAPPGDPP